MIMPEQARTAPPLCLVRSQQRRRIHLKMARSVSGDIACGLKRRNAQHRPKQQTAYLHTGRSRGLCDHAVNQRA